MVACRATVLWLLISGAALFGSQWLAPLAAAPLDDAAAGGLEGMLAGLSAAALIGCLLWVWLVTTVVYARLAWDRADPERLLRATPRGCPAGLTRLLLVGSGAVLVASLAAPSTAMTYADPTEPTNLTGLPLPDRSTLDSPIPQHRPSAPAHTPEPEARVAAGDTLWSIAAEQLGPRATPAEIATLWHRIYRTNHPQVGDDPDLILPGQRLQIPQTSDQPTSPGATR